MENIKKWYPVRMKFDTNDKEWFNDEIEGLSPEDALKNAKWNWSDAIIIELI